MTDNRLFHTATLLKDGKVLIAGGFHFDDLTGYFVATAELYGGTTAAVQQIRNALATIVATHDWIADCAIQATVYAALVAAYDSL